MRLIYLLPSGADAAELANFKVTVLTLSKLEYYYDAATADKLSTWAVIMMIVGATIIIIGCCAYCLCCKGKNGAATGDDDGYQRVSSSNNNR